MYFLLLQRLKNWEIRERKKSREYEKEAEREEERRREMVRLVVWLVIFPALFSWSHLEWNILLLHLWVVIELSFCIKAVCFYTKKKNPVNRLETEDV